MSLLSHFESEVKFLPHVSAEDKKHLKKLVEIFAADGHSGSSAAFVIGWLKNNMVNLPTELPDDTIPSIKGIIQYLNKSEVVLSDEMKKYLLAILEYKPVTPLTGDDSEWFVHDYDDHLHCQNIRCGNIFKNKDGEAYIVDGIVFYEPSVDYSYWSGWVGRGSTLPVTFPYDADTPHIDVYFADRARSSRLAPDINPDDYLRVMRSFYLAGVDPMSKRLSPQLFVNLDEAIETIENIASLFNADGSLDAVKRNAFEAEFNSFYDDQCPAVFRRMMRILSQIPSNAMMVGNNTIVFPDRSTMYVRPCEVRVPSYNYQSWVPRYTGNKPNEKAYVVSLTHYDFAESTVEIEVDGDVIVDDNKYLFQRRRELGLAHPSKSKRKPPKATPTLTV